MRIAKSNYIANPIQQRIDQEHIRAGFDFPPLRAHRVLSLESGSAPNGNFVKFFCASPLLLAGASMFFDDERMQTVMILAGVMICALVIIAEMIARYYECSIINRIDTRIIRRSYYQRITAQEEKNYKREVAVYLKRLDSRKREIAHS